jgi:hypothetical protein
MTLFNRDPRSSNTSFIWYRPTLLDHTSLYQLDEAVSRSAAEPIRQSRPHSGYHWVPAGGPHSNTAMSLPAFVVTAALRPRSSPVTRYVAGCARYDIFHSTQHSARQIATSCSTSAGLARWGLRPGLGAAEVLHNDPPLLRARGLLTHAECDALIAAQRDVQAEADLYLNHRVNAEVEHGLSAEAGKLIAEWDVAAEALSAGDRSGFRTQIDPKTPALSAVLPRIQALLGLEDRTPEFAEGQWVRPSRRRFCIRDQTLVHYRVGEGVSPHVDGKDATVLMYLSGTEGGVDAGGATCFPEIGLRVPPVKGDVLLYWSKDELLHYAERVWQGEKFICQLLVDFHVRNVRFPLLAVLITAIFPIRRV